MAIQIKVVDTNFNEHFHVVEDVSFIYYSDNNDGLYRKNYEDYHNDQIENLSLADVKEAIDYHDWNIEDLGFDLDNYEDQILENASEYEIWDLLKRNRGYCSLDDIIKRMKKEGYSIIEPSGQKELE